MTRTHARSRILALAVTALAASLALALVPAPVSANTLPPVQIAPSRPDLVIIQHPDNLTGSLDAVIINRGTVAAGAFKVRFDGGETTKFIRIDGLAPGQRVNVYLDFINHPCRLYTITVDISNAVVESHENNNAISEFVCTDGSDLD